jgi:hypothetical protein
MRLNKAGRQVARLPDRLRCKTHHLNGPSFRWESAPARPRAARPMNLPQLRRASASAAPSRRPILTFRSARSAAKPRGAAGRPARPPRCRGLGSSGRRDGSAAGPGSGGDSGRGDGGRGGGGGDGGGGGSEPHAAWLQLLASLLPALAAAGAFFGGGCRPAAAAPVTPALTPEELERLSSPPATT